MRIEKLKLEAQAAEHRQISHDGRSANNAVDINSNSLQPPPNTNPRSDQSAAQPSLVSNIQKKRTQNVINIAQRTRILQLMMNTCERDGPAQIASKVVKQFPLLFRTSPDADIMCEIRIWNFRVNYELCDDKLKRSGVISCITRNTTSGLKHLHLKARERRGSKRA